MPEPELGALLGKAPERIHGVDSFLRRYTHDGTAYWSFVHPNARQATDRY